MLAAAALAREHATGERASRRAVGRAVRQVSIALGNTPAVARASYIDPRVIASYEQGTVIELPADMPEAAMPLRIEVEGGDVIIEHPTDPNGHPLCEDVERRVRSLLAD